MFLKNYLNQIFLTKNSNISENLNENQILTQNYIIYWIKFLDMYKWDDSFDSISEDNLVNPKFGMYYEKESRVRAFPAADSEGFSQFQNSLFEKKNETSNIEYNPKDVFKNALKYQEIQAKNPKINSSKRPGFQLFDREVRPLLLNQNQNLSYGDITKMIVQKWNELSHEIQENYCQRAKDETIQLITNNSAIFY